MLVLGMLFWKKNAAITKQKPVSRMEGDFKVALIQNLDDVNFVFNFADDKGFFAKNNLKVAGVVLDADSDSVMQTGDIDARIGDLSGTISAYLNNTEPRWIATPFRRFTGIAISRFSKDEASKIKKVAIIKFGTAAQTIVDATLRKIGVDPSMLEYVAAPSEAVREAMLESGQADFTLINSEKFLLDSGKIDKFQVYSSEELFGGTSFLRVITTTAKKVQEKPEQLQKFVTAFYQATKYMLANKDETLQYLENKEGLSKEDAAKFYNSFSQAVQDVQYVPDLNQISNLTESVQRILKPTNPSRDMQNFVESSFAQKAVK